MAGAISDATAGFLLENLKELVQNNADLIAGAEAAANKLCDDLLLLKGYFKQCMEECSGNDHILQALANDIRKLVYRAEDTIETYIANPSSKQKNRGATKGAIDHAMELCKDLEAIVREAEGIMRDVQELRKNKKTGLGFQAIQLERGHVKRVKKPPVSDEIVELKDVMEDVMTLLNGGTDDLQTISIVGMNGLGKTTLARNVFNHPTIEHQFTIHAFVEVSLLYSRKEVLLKILQAFGTIREEMIRMSQDYLEQEIRKYLEKRSFLIVLDDVWTRDAWNDFKACFPSNQRHSRVLLTTPNMNLAQYVSNGVKPYRLRFLTRKESQELLRMRVFGTKNDIPSHLTPYETLILKWCIGLPFNIVMVAGILTDHWDETSWWRKVAMNLDNDLLTEETPLFDAMQLNFNNLSFHVKLCFLYLGVFREDFEISAKTLFKLWVSESFVPLANENKTSEDIAEDYLEELVDRNLVMVAKKRLNGRIKTIRIKGALHEFCWYQATNEDVFREIESNGSDGSISSDDGCRLCINSNIVEYINSKPSGTHVRSFLSFANYNATSPVGYIHNIPKAFKVLRVLDMRSVKFTQFPSTLYLLFLLKYIAISSDLKAIPKEMSNLSYLQTLRFETTADSVEIKADIWKMTQLRHLETNATTSLLETSEAPSVNANLQTLPTISLESCRSEVFDKAPRLKKLGICGTLGPALEATGKGSLFDALSRLDFLESMKLLNDDATVKICSFPNEKSFPEHLTKLTLQNTMLDWVCMSTLGRLRKLEVLKLKDNAFSGILWDTENDGFRALKVLHIGRTDLVSWKASPNHFPSLTQLYLRQCTKLASIPLALIYISTLQLIDIYYCNCKVTTYARKLQILAKLPVKTKDKVFKNATLKLSVYPPYK